MHPPLTKSDRDVEQSSGSSGCKGGRNCRAYYLLGCGHSRFLCDHVGREDLRLIYVKDPDVAIEPFFILYYKVSGLLF